MVKLFVFCFQGLPAEAGPGVCPDQDLDLPAKITEVEIQMVTNLIKMIDLD